MMLLLRLPLLCRLSSPLLRLLLLRCICWDLEMLRGLRSLRVLPLHRQQHGLRLRLLHAQVGARGR